MRGIRCLLPLDASGQKNPLGGGGAANDLQKKQLNNIKVSDLMEYLKKDNILEIDNNETICNKDEEEIELDKIRYW